MRSYKQYKPSPYFCPGDIIEWDRRNLKSIVVKVIKKIDYIYDPNNWSQQISSESYPNTYFRLELEYLFNFMIGDPNFKAGLEAYIMRTESLNEL